MAEYLHVDSSRALPTGVVTFLLTDIEGSTRLWELEPEAMREALVRHDAVVNACVRRFGGHVVKSKGEGDSVFSVFTHARDAVTTALVLQCALSVEQWTTSTPLRVRMAIHTGQIELRDGDYFGPTVNRCARLRGLAKGGQVLLSGVTAKLIQGQLPNDASLKDLGTHQLKDLSAPERVWQLAHPRMNLGQVVQGKVEDRERPLQTQATVWRAYKLTDHLNRTEDGRELRQGKTYAATGLTQEEDAGAIDCYLSANSAALLNALNERLRMPRLWEVALDREPAPGSVSVACREVTALRRVDLPAPTGKQHAHFAVLCAQAAYEGGKYEDAFNDWVASWLGGGDNAGVQARELAEALSTEVQRDTLLGLPQDLMLANAARAAAHASKLSFLVGRARDEENKLAVHYAVEAIRTALRMARLDVVALADQAMPKAVAPVAPIRRTPITTPNRILRALPT